MMRKHMSATKYCNIHVQWHDEKPMNEETSELPLSELPIKQCHTYVQIVEIPQADEQHNP